jgi:hypothetical protein
MKSVHIVAVILCLTLHCIAQENAPGIAEKSAEVKSPEGSGTNSGKSWVRFFGELGLLDVGAGARIYLSKSWKQYLQISLQYDSFANYSFIRLPLLGHWGGTHWHGIGGIAANIAASGGGTPQAIQIVGGLNYDINVHWGFNFEFLTPVFFPSNTPASLLLDAQYAF